MKFAKKSLMVLIAGVLLMGSAKAEVKIYAQVDTSQDIYVGENFAYHVVIDGDNQAGQVDISPLAAYNPQSAGNRDVSQSSITIVNGKTSKNIVKRYVMSYSLTANQIGTIQLPPVTVTLDGKTYQTNSVQLNILTPGTTELLGLDVSLSQQQCYVGQPVILTVKFYISADIGNFQLNIPALTGDDFYVEDPDSLDSQEKEYNIGNGITARISQTRTTHNGKEAALLSFSKVLIPKHDGEISLAAGNVSADVAMGRARSQDMFDDFFGRKQYKRFMVSSQPLTMSVRPLPAEGQPAGFYGLVGQYTISASATPVKVSVGDPITLTIKIGGGKYLKPVQWPALEVIAGMADNFKIPAEKASPAMENGVKVFTQTIRADNDKVTEIPSIPLVYFDADKGSYKIAKTEPIKLDVSPTKILTGADLEGRDAEFVLLNKEVEAIKKGLSANYESPDALANQNFSLLSAAVGLPYVVIWGGPFILLIVSALARVMTYTTPQKIAAKSRRAAAGKALAQLKNLMGSSSAEGWHEQLAAAMKQYLGQRFDKVAGSLTSNDCFEVVLAQTQDCQIADKYKAIIAECEAAQYASAGNDLDVSRIEEAMDLIRTIEKKAGK